MSPSSVLRPPSSVFPTIGSAECCRYLTGARRAPNSLRAQIAASLFFFASASASTPSPISDSPIFSQLLSAIRTVEDVKFPARPGKHGELGYFRFREKTWRQHTIDDFARCGREPALELVVARKHLRWLVQSLAAAGEVPTPYRLALAWNAGLEATLHDRTPPATRDYARRVVNVFTADSR